MHTQQHLQSGKTLGGIMIGLVLAVVIIALLMWYMNTHKTTFQPYVPPVKPQTGTEVLRPNGNTGSLPPQQTIPGKKDDKPDDLGELIDHLDKTDEKATPQTPVTPVIVRKETLPKKSDALSAQDFLNGAAGKSQLTPKTATSGTNSSKTILQIGSFTTRIQAESQQAKLLMLDVTTRIETATASGQTIYRVRSNALSPAQAQAVQQQLNENHIDSIVLPNP